MHRAWGASPSLVLGSVTDERHFAIGRSNAVRRMSRPPGHRPAGIPTPVARRESGTSMALNGRRFIAPIRRPRPSHRNRCRCTRLPTTRRRRSGRW
jgi:hypothetical protein